MKSLFRKILVLVAFTPLYVHAQEVVSLADLNKPIDPATGAYILAQEQAGSEATYKMVYEVRARAAIEHTIKVEPQFITNPIAAESYRREALASVRQSLDGEDWRNGYTEALLKDVVDVAKRHPRYGAAIPKNVLNKGIESFMAYLSVEGSTPIVEASMAINTATWIFNAAQDPKHPNHEYAKGLVKKYRPDINPEINYDLRSDVRAVRDRKSMLEIGLRLIERQNKPAAQNIKQTKNTKSAKGNLQAAAKSMISQVEPKKIDTSNLEKNIYEAQESTAGLTAIGTGLLLVNDQKGAQFFYKTANVARAWQNINEIYLNQAKTGQKMAGSLALGWVGMTFSVVQLMSATENQSEMQALHEQLREISQQLFEMRKEMKNEFDLLRRRLDIDFNQIILETGHIRSTLDSLEQKSLQLISKTDELRKEMKDGIQLVWRQKMVSVNSRCIGVSSTGKSYVRDEGEAAECRDQFADLAAGAYASSVSKNSSQLDNLSDEEYAALTKFLSNKDKLFYANTHHPSNWLEGSRSFVDFFTKNPKHKVLTKKSSTGKSELGLENLKNIGQNIVKTLKHLALTEPSNNMYQLKTDLFKELLLTYRMEVEEALLDASRKSETIAGLGPKPTVDGYEQKIIEDEKYDFMGKAIGFCNSSEKKVIRGNIDYWSSQFDEAYALGVAGYKKEKGPNHPDNKRAESVVQRQKSEHLAKNRVLADAMFTAMFSQMDPNWFKLDKSFLKRLPESVVWASRMRSRFKNVTVTPCFAEISIPQLYARYVKGIPEFHVTVRFVMNLYLTYDGLEGDPILFRQLVANPRIDVPNYRFNYDPKAQFSIIYNIWDGQHLYPRGYDFVIKKPVKGFGSDHFHAIHLLTDPRFRKFEQEFTKELERNRQKGRKVFVNELKNSEIGSDRILAQLITLGIDPVNPKATDFLRWLLSPEGLQSPQKLALQQLDLNQYSKIMQDVDDRIKEASERLDKLAAEKTLRPRATEYQQVLDGLNKL